MGSQSARTILKKMIFGHDRIERRVDLRHGYIDLASDLDRLACDERDLGCHQD
jgi:hypothetical protein